MKLALIVVYKLGAAATFIYLTFFNGFHYNWWNWNIALTVNPFLAAIWPLYWAVILPLSVYVIDPVLGR